MAGDDSILDAAQIARARALLTPARPIARVWPVMAAAGCLTVASLGFVTAMVLAPPVVKQHTVRSAPG